MRSPSDAERSPDEASKAVRDPRALASYSLAQWERAIAALRSTNLLGRVAAALHDERLLDTVPEAPRAHLESAGRVASAQHAAILREIERVHDALAPSGMRVVLLKGCAYVVAALPVARGRTFNDMDILVPRERIAEAEAALMLAGWTTTHHDAYDQRYYREWMHELPPMRHATRGTVVDVHHGIMPLTARVRVDAGKLLSDAQAVSNDSRFSVLAPVDMVLHAVAHLVYNDDLRSALRDLADVHGLLLHHSRDEAFWDRLGERAAELGLQRAFFYALRAAVYFFGTAVPAPVVERAARGAPSAVVRPLMDRVFAHGLRGPDPIGGDGVAALARSVLYVRAHWLRMPPMLLARHLAVKAGRREHDEAARAPV